MLFFASNTTLGHYRRFRGFAEDHWSADPALAHKLAQILLA
jgi:hypothetical protein